MKIHLNNLEDKGKRRYMLHECTSTFYRRIGLPKNVNTENIDASSDEGVLKVAVPFKDLPKPKKATIGSSENIKK